MIKSILTQNNIILNYDKVACVKLEVSGKGNDKSYVITAYANFTMFDGYRTSPVGEKVRVGEYSSYEQAVEVYRELFYWLDNGNSLFVAPADGEKLAVHGGNVSYGEDEEFDKTVRDAWRNRFTSYKEKLRCASLLPQTKLHSVTTESPSLPLSVVNKALVNDVKEEIKAKSEWDSEDIPNQNSPSAQSEQPTEEELIKKAHQTAHDAAMLRRMILLLHKDFAGKHDVEYISKKSGYAVKTVNFFYSEMKNSKQSYIKTYTGKKKKAFPKISNAKKKTAHEKTEAKNLIKKYMVDFNGHMTFTEFSELSGIPKSFYQVCATELRETYDMKFKDFEMLKR